MHVTQHIHALKIPFTIPLSPEKHLDRFVYAFIVMVDEITLIDCGVAGSEDMLFDYIRKHGRDPEKISLLVLSHSHPDHLGAAQKIKEITGCSIAAHQNEKHWIEDTEKQFTERPVPGFQSLVGGPVPVDNLLTDGETLKLGKGVSCTVRHTPGHSSGSISLFFAEEKALFTGDAIPLPGDMPIYEDISTCRASMEKLMGINDAEVLLSSWESPIHGREKINERFAQGLAYLREIHTAVLDVAGDKNEDIMVLCEQVVGSLGLPPFAANPLVARALASSLTVKHNTFF